MIPFASIIDGCIWTKKSLAPDHKEIVAQSTRSHFKTDRIAVHQREKFHTQELHLRHALSDTSSCCSSKPNLTSPQHNQTENKHR